MKKVVFSTALEFNSHAELVSDCIDCIKNYDLDTGDYSGIPENWEDEDTWTDEVICNFLKYQGSIFYSIYEDFENAFNDDINEVKVEIKS